MRVFARIGAHSPNGYGALEEAILGYSRIASCRICSFTSRLLASFSMEDVMKAFRSLPQRSPYQKRKSGASFVYSLSREI
jgi:hypothetical protein